MYRFFGVLYATVKLLPDNLYTDEVVMNVWFGPSLVVPYLLYQLAHGAL